MTATYSNKKDIRNRVAAMVSTYHPNNAPVTVVKASKYVALVPGEDKLFTGISVRITKRRIEQCIRFAT